MLGNSLGSLGELAYGFYLYKLFIGDKPEVTAKKKEIHQDIRAGNTVPFSVIVFKPFFNATLPYEIEAYIRKLGGEAYYAETAEALRKVIFDISSLGKNIA